MTCSNFEATDSNGQLARVGSVESVLRLYQALWTIANSAALCSQNHMKLIVEPWRESGRLNMHRSRIRLLVNELKSAHYRNVARYRGSTGWEGVRVSHVRCMFYLSDTGIQAAEMVQSKKLSGR